MKKKVYYKLNRYKVASGKNQTERHSKVAVSCRIRTLYQSVFGNGDDKHGVCGDNAEIYLGV